VRRHHPGPIDLFGNSLGAMVAILAGAEDCRIRSVVASNCPACIADFLLTRPRRVLFAIAKAAALLAPLRFSINHFYSYEQLIPDPSWISTIERDALITDARRLSVDAYRTMLEYWDGSAAVTALHKPLLLVQGRNDQLQPPKQSQILYDTANDPSEYLLLDTGHLPHLEDTATVGGVLVDWLARTVPSS
jgi:pimeloyl-ACP methyl ester carboxylesterase